MLLSASGQGLDRAPQRACLPVEWHGHDLDATLDSFTDWCDALHAGAKAPPPPELAVF